MVLIFASISCFVLGNTNDSPVIFGQNLLLFVGVILAVTAGGIYVFLGRIPLSKFKDEDVLKVLAAVKLNPETYFYRKYPHELSGGERQRVATARALILNPELIIADEPTSMLDVSVRATILELMKDLRKNFGLTIIFITHDLATAKYFCDRIAIMYAGEVIELGTSEDIFKDPRHPYAWSLLQAVPIPDPTYKREVELPKGEVPDPANYPSGCRFHPRCRFAEQKCAVVAPTLNKVNIGHLVSCHFAESLYLNERHIQVPSGDK